MQLTYLLEIVRQILPHHKSISFHRAIVMLLENRDTIGVMKMGKKEDGSLGNFQTALEFPTVSRVGGGGGCCGR